MSYTIDEDVSDSELVDLTEPDDPEGAESEGSGASDGANSSELSENGAKREIKQRSSTGKAENEDAEDAK